METRCKNGHRKLIAEAAYNRQLERLAKAGYSREETREIMPRCSDCITKFLKRTRPQGNAEGNEKLKQWLEGTHAMQAHAQPADDRAVWTRRAQATAEYLAPLFAPWRPTLAYRSPEAGLLVLVSESLSKELCLVNLLEDPT